MDNIKLLNSINKDKEVFDLIQKEKERQINGLELIASENFASENVMKATGSVLTNKYAEGYPGKRYYGGCEVIDQVENIAINRLKELFSVDYANVQPHSGSQANSAVFDAFLKPGDKILGLDLSHGGHLTHGSPVNFSGKIYNSSFYTLNKDGVFDYDNSKLPMQKLLGTPQKDQEMIVLEGVGHIIPEDIIIGNHLRWLKKHIKN